MQELKQSEIEKILNTYSVRKDEFKEVSPNSHSYQSTLVSGYLVTLSVDSDERILVSHTQDGGKRTFVDVWERTEIGLLFKFRNPWNLPLSDADYIKDLERELTELIIAEFELKKRLDKIESNYYELITDPYTVIVRPKNERGAGRKKSQECSDTIAKVKALLDAGYSNAAVMKELNLSKSKFFRYRRGVTH